MIGAGSVDPELLNARLSAICDSSLRAGVEAVVKAAFSSLATLGAVPIGQLEDRAAQASAEQLWTDRLSERTEAIRTAIEVLRAAMKPLERDEDDLPSLSAEPEASAVKEAVPVLRLHADGVSLERPAARLLESEERIAARVGELFSVMGFVFSSEVKAFWGRVPALLKLSDGWELINAVQEHTGSLKSALSALLTGLFATLPAPTWEESDADHDAELLAARELRARVFELRDVVLAEEKLIKSNPPSAWREPLERIQRHLSGFMRGPGFAWMRASDKRSFIKLRGLVDDVLTMWSPLRAAPAGRAVESLARYLEALEMINQREVLVSHDRRSLEAVVHHMARATRERGEEGRRSIAAGLSALAEIQGRDRDLDVLLSMTLSPGAPVPVEQILLRAEKVLALLRGDH